MTFDIRNRIETYLSTISTSTPKPIINIKIRGTLKQNFQPPRFSDIEEKYKKDDIAKGKVTKFNPYGAFVQITPKIQGLCHISEFGTKEKMEKVLEVDKTYKFQILSIDPKEHRMILKLEEK